MPPMLSAPTNPYPASVPPETWEMDSIFTRMLNRQTKKWARNGYQWEWALELEFTPQTFAEFEFFMKQSHIELRDGKPIQREILNAFHEYELVKSGEGLNLSSARKTYERLSGLLVEKNDAEKLEELQQFYARLDREDAETQRFGVADLMLAEMHILPWDRGGIADLIEPHFGSYEYGKGWWDGQGTAEVRLPPVVDTGQFIGNYAKIVERITEKCRAYGLVANFAAAQINFNIRRFSDGKNMMDPQDETDIDFHKRILAGIQRFHDEAPHIRSDFRTSDRIAGDVNLSAFLSKHAGIRLHDNRWEMRRSCNNGYLHLSRDMAFLMAGAGYAAFDIKDIDRYISRKKLPIESRRVPVAVHRFDSRSTFVEIINNSPVTENNYIEADINLTYGYADLLLEEIGKENADIFSIEVRGPKDEANFTRTDLRGQFIWLALFELIQIQEDGTLSAPTLHPEIQAYIENIKVKEWKDRVVSGAIKPLYGTRLLRENLHLLERSPILRASMPKGDIQILQKEFAAIFDVREPRHALEISDHLQQILRVKRGMAESLDDLSETLGVEPSLYSINETIIQFAVDHIIQKSFKQRDDRNKHIDRTMGKAERTEQMRCSRSSLIERSSQLLYQTAVIAEDLRMQADKIQQENPGHNRLPALCEDFRRAADFLSGEAHDPRTYVGHIAKKMIADLERHIEDGSFDPFSPLEMMERPVDIVSNAVLLAFRRPQKTVDDIVAMYEGAMDILADSFARAANDARAEDDSGTGNKFVFAEIAGIVGTGLRNRRSWPQLRVVLERHYQ